MTVTTVTLVDDAEKTITQTTDTVLKYTSVTTVWKVGSAGFNEQQLQQKAQAAIADLDTAEGLINTSGWDGLTVAQRKAISLGLVRDVRAVIRLALNLLDSPS